MPCKDGDRRADELVPVARPRTTSRSSAPSVHLRKKYVCRCRIAEQTTFSFLLPLLDPLFDLSRDCRHKALEDRAFASRPFRPKVEPCIDYLGEQDRRSPEF
jgi:hypothetical protein